MSSSEDTQTFDRRDREAAPRFSGVQAGRGGPGAGYATAGTGAGEREAIRLADEYAAALCRMEAAHYEEFDNVIKKYRIVIAALRAYEAAGNIEGAAQAAEIEVAAQALADDVWHPPLALAQLTPSEATRLRRQARIVLEAVQRHQARIAPEAASPTG